MAVGVMLGMAMLVGVPPAVVGLIGLALIHPVAGAGAVAALALLNADVRRRTAPGPASEAFYHAAVAAELARGASLRWALEHAAARVPELSLRSSAAALGAGVPLTDVSVAMALRFPTTGPLLRPALAVAAEAGGRAQHVFERLAEHATAKAEAAREQRTATAQARLSAWIVGGLPIATLTFAVITGRLGALMAVRPIGVVIVAVGGLLLAAGLGLVVVIVRRRM